MSESKARPKILVLMSGSIACYKACGLVSMLVKNGFEVKVASSASALKFIGEATLEGLTGQSVESDLWKKGAAMEHIHLERWADLIIAAPASAHFINRIASGVGDDLLTTIFLAHEFKKPFLIAPAMNTAMYLNPVTQKSLETLKNFGVKILESASGVLACGETGYGKLLEPELLYQEILNSLKSKGFAEQTAHSALSLSSAQTSSDKKSAPRVLVTAGGTREAIDDVRFITNSSTGVTGEKIARTLAELGFDVTLDLAQTSSVKPGLAYQLQRFDSFESLQMLLKDQLSSSDYDLVIHSAAVSDFSVDKAVGKMSSDQDLTLTFKRNPKIVSHLKEWSRNKKMKLIAFKLTSNATEEQVKQKVNKVFKESQADLVVQNDASAVQNRDQHPFQVFSSTTVSPVNGVEALVAQIVKAEFL